MTDHPFFDSTPRWYRVTVRGADHERLVWTGHLTRDGDKIRGRRLDSTDAAPGDLTLNVLIAAPEDIVKVQAKHPRYDEWITLPWPADSWSWGRPARASVGSVTVDPSMPQWLGWARLAAGAVFIGWCWWMGGRT